MEILENKFLKFEGAITEEVLNQKVYRIFSYTDFINTLIHKTLTFRKPKAWDDPYENIFFSRLGANEAGQRFNLSSLQDNYYANCWSYVEESDFMWRVYAPNKDGIKVMSTIGNLYAEVLEQGDYWIGNVSYLSQKKIQEVISQPVDINEVALDTSLALENNLLIKRSEFSSERELRLIALSRKFIIPDIYVLHTLNINPDKLFKEVIIDPRLDLYRFNNWMKAIKNVGYNGKIDRSTLYDPPGFSDTYIHKLEV